MFLAHRDAFHQEFTVFVPTTVQLLDAKVNRYTVRLLRVSTFSGRLQGGTRQRKRLKQAYIIITQFCTQLLCIQLYEHFKIILKHGTWIIQDVPLATEPGISLIILTPIKILQRNLNRSMFVV